MDLCANCDHPKKHHINGSDCCVEWCTCNEYVDADEINDDLDEFDDELDEEDKEQIKLILKSLFFFSDHVYKNACRIQELNCDFYNEVPDVFLTSNKELASSIQDDIKCLERALTLLSAYLNVEVPSIDDIKSEFEERREFDRMLRL